MSDYDLHKLQEQLNQMKWEKEKKRHSVTQPDQQQQHRRRHRKQDSRSSVDELEKVMSQHPVQHGVERRMGSPTIQLGAAAPNLKMFASAAYARSESPNWYGAIIGISPYLHTSQIKHSLIDI